MHQLLTQFAASFEFNEALLEMLAEQAYCPEYAEFAYQSPRERASLVVRVASTGAGAVASSVASTSTSCGGARQSLWRHLLGAPEVAAPYTNPLYEPTLTVLLPALAYRSGALCFPQSTHISKSLHSTRHTKRRLIDIV